MKKMKYLNGFLILAIALVIGACNNSPETGSDVINKDVSAAEFKQLSEASDGIILDVRTPGEVAEGVIPGAMHIDWHGDNFEAEVNKLDKTKPVYVYCKSGGRSGKACNLMVSVGFKEVYNLSGGITAWEGQGYEVTKKD